MTLTDEGGKDKFHSAVLYWLSCGLCDGSLQTRVSKERHMYPYLVMLS